MQVECVTCHRGVSEPKLTGQVLAQAAEEGGPPAIPAKWDELRAEYYGTHSYDFSELTLSEFARARFAAGKPNEARAALEILVDEPPDSLMGHFMLGDIERIEGNVDAARAHFQRASRLECDACGLTVEGRFAMPLLARLAPDDQQLVESFVVC